ncbi:DUF1302 family protein [Paraburkholderia sp. 5N]|uniref:DUF1302 family protein n=2 Tax=Paraburkholderia elongata TaxID=2675747 RepID=A0A972SPW6_9BURK|nr:DUF1302 family protein [Paraburkholderia elongata]
MFDARPQETLAGRLKGTIALSAVLMATVPTGAWAFSFNMPSDWQVSWDNTLTYNLGMRVNGVDPLIGSNPNYDESDYKFAHAGDIVTNRTALLSELNVTYQGHVGFRLSASIWKDFAYGGGDVSNPGIYAPAGGGFPAITYHSIDSYSDSKYSSYTNRYYAQGEQLLDAFVFDNFDVAGKNVSLKLGQFTEYWGNALFFPLEGISYSQGAIDAIALSASPGAEVQQLFLPRPQLSLTAHLTPEVSLSGQYAFVFNSNRLPAGGTFLAPADFLFTGPSNFFVGAVPSSQLGLPAGGYLPINVPAGASNTPRNLDNNFGVKLGWTPAFLNGGMGFYFRRFDETQPWAPLLDFGAGGVPTDYHLSYNRGVQLFGYSLDTTIGNIGTGFEASYRRNTALNSTASPLVPVEPQGAKGNTLNLIANAIVPLSRSFLWDTGTLTAELAYTRLLSVTANQLLYNGVGYAGCSTGKKWDGCSTRNYAAAEILFQPQWLQVFPGVDLSMPISDVFGIYGNNPQVGTSQNGQGTNSFSIGVQATIRQKTTVTLAYNGYHAHTNGVAFTPSGLAYYSSGNGLFGNNDRNWVSLTMQSSF